MENSSINPYRTPGSNVSSINNSSGDGINSFTRFSAWGVFGLSLITLGMYPVYWLYTRAKIANTVHDQKISSGLLTTFVILAIVSFVVGFAGEANNSQAFAASGILINIAYMVVYLITLFKMKNILQDVIGAPLSPVLTFFFFTIYLQYKINQKIDGEI